MRDEAKPASKGRQTQVPGQVDILCEKIEELARSVKALEEKLQPVLRQEVDTKTSLEDNDELVPLANQIRINGEAVSNVTAIIDSINSMLEL